jgi:hypothetical protein|tara:strand:+ start:562 stop:1077 length:516 start_codon:yes stop_codon:yes gene_type:complete
MYSKNSIYLKMNYIKISLLIFFSLAVTRFIPHPPNFTSLIALSFYVPAIFGISFIPFVIFAFIATDIVIGIHSTIFFTWGSVLLIGFISKYFLNSFSSRILGALSGAFIFFIITNFGVWSLGSYGYNFNGLLTCYIAAIPFFSYTIISTLFFSLMIEFIYVIILKVKRTIY